MTDHFTLDGAAITDIPSLYDEINRVFMADEDWQLGQSLDALDDLLYGGYGALQGRGPVTVVWRDMEASRAALGNDATRAWLQQKRQQPGRFNMAQIEAQLQALERGDGQTYFDIIIELFATHRNITLLPA